jgi:phosphomannomutase/phosphoglucomutase
MFNKNIFRSYDIRGVYGKDFDEKFAEDLGRAFATFIGTKEVIVGRDVRLSSESLSKALIKGLTDGGCDVIDVGLVTTPLLYFSVAHLGKSGGIMITASHNPPEFNGFKIVGKMSEPIAEGSGMGKIKGIIMSGKYSMPENIGKVKRYDRLFDDYANFVLKKIKIKKRLKVVLDTCNSVGGLVAPGLFEKAGCEVIAINKDLDGSFPSRPPEPKADNLQALQEAVRMNSADLGVAYDGDSDRAVFVDEKGNVIDSGSLIIMIFAEHFLKKSKDSKVVFDTGCSFAVEDIIKQLGGIPIITAIGTSNIKKGMGEENAIFGGESSNHMYFADTFNFDDAVFASLKMAEIISETGSLYEKVKSLPKYPYMAEWVFEYSDEEKFKVIESMKKKFRHSGKDMSDLDGIKLMWNDGWVLWRVSNTAPQIKVYVEAKTDERFEELKNFAKDELTKAMVIK